MAKKIDVNGLKRRTLDSIDGAILRYERATSALNDHLMARWVAQMTEVEIHAIWERYVEMRLVAGLNHDPAHFLTTHGIGGVRNMSSGFAQYAVREGRRYFDFRSTSDLLSRGDDLLSNAKNPFRRLQQSDREYVDALATIRNCIVHRSDAAIESYKRKLKKVYAIRSVPEPEEFLHAIDNRPSSPARGKSRLKGLSEVVVRAVRST